MLTNIASLWIIGSPIETEIAHERTTRNHRRVIGACLHCDAPSFLTPKPQPYPPKGALQLRAQGYIRLPNGRAVSGFAHEYERHGTTTLFAALETATGLVQAGHYKRRRRREFLDFMNGIIDCYGNEKEIHVILDNLNTHKPKNDRWLKSHPNVHFHFTPTHSSWLNQIECWFSILSRQTLQGASFVDVKQLREAIDHFICAYNAQAAPFEWRRSEIKQQPLRDNIAYFCK